MIVSSTEIGSDHLPPYLNWQSTESGHKKFQGMQVQILPGDALREAARFELYKLLRVSGMLVGG